MVFDEIDEIDEASKSGKNEGGGDMEDDMEDEAVGGGGDVLPDEQDELSEEELSTLEESVKPIRLVLAKVSQLTSTLFLSINLLFQHWQL